MTLPATTKKKLAKITSLLESAPLGELDARQAADQIAAVLELLASQKPRWIDIGPATRLIGIPSEEVILNWARIGLIRSQSLPDGTRQLLLEDVLTARRDEELLAAIGDPLTDEELRVIKESRPGSNPWERPVSDTNNDAPHASSHATGVAQSSNAPDPVNTKQEINELLSLLESTPLGVLDPRQIGDRIDSILLRLAEQNPLWVDVHVAARLVGIPSTEIILNWTKYGAIRSQPLPNGERQLFLDDLLRLRRDHEFLMAVGDPLTEEELRILKESRPGSNPWERTPNSRAS